MDITWLGHACFRIKGSQATIITDPFPPELGYTLPAKLEADIVTVSHPHPSHSYVQGVGGSPKVVQGPGEYEIAGVLIIGVGTFHDNERGAQRGKNTAYLMEIDGVSICHLGDIGHVLSDEQLEEIGDVDVLLLPVGGHNTIGGAVAAEIIRQIEPKAVIPMHYQTPELKRTLDPLESFLKEMGLGPVEPRPKLTVSRTGLLPGTQVYVLSY